MTGVVRFPRGVENDDAKIGKLVVEKVTMGQRRRSPTWFRPSDQVLSRRVGEEVVLVHLETDRIHSLNRTGARLWELLERGLSLAEITSRLLQEFSVDERVLELEIDRIVKELRASRLILEPEIEDR